MRAPSCYLALSAVLAVLRFSSITRGQDAYHETFRALRTDGKAYFNERSGRPCPEVKQLIFARYKATAALCHEIDQVGQANTAYVATLYKVLGIVKDPAAIPWLTTKLGTPQERFVYGDWLSEWTRSRDREVIRYADGIYAHFTMKWMGDTDAWRKFLLELLDRAAARDSRWRCVRALSECFHDKPTMDFFAATERKCVGAELLWVDAYLIQHERDIDVGRLRKVIAELQQSPDGQQDLYWFARSGKHPAIVPWLISILGESDHDWVVPSLKMITFQYTLKSQEQWQGWFAENGERSRKEWIESSLATFEAVLSREPARAADILQHANWVEPSIAPRVENWLVHRDLHPILARWLLKCYHPYWRNALKRVAERIVNESWGDLDQFTQDGLKELDFVAESELSWEEGWDRSFP